MGVDFESHPVHMGAYLEPRPPSNPRGYSGYCVSYCIAVWYRINTKYSNTIRKEKGSWHAPWTTAPPTVLGRWTAYGAAVPHLARSALTLFSLSQSQSASDGCLREGVRELSANTHPRALHVCRDSSGYPCDAVGRSVGHIGRASGGVPAPASITAHQPPVDPAGHDSVGMAAAVRRRVAPTSLLRTLGSTSAYPNGLYRHSSGASSLRFPQ